MTNFWIMNWRKDGAMEFISFKNWNVRRVYFPWEPFNLIATKHLLSLSQRAVLEYWYNTGGKFVPGR